MTKTAIMQPYLFPYLGYWQMIAAVDNFVLFDDVNFIKKGWINRNNVLLDGKAHMFTLPLAGVSQNKLINETYIMEDPKEKQKLLRTISQCYARAPLFKTFFPVVEEIINYPESNLAKFLHNHFIKMFEYMEIGTKLAVSSQIDKDNELKAQNKIIDICKRLGTTTYINAIGGQELYEESRFRAENMDLKFIKMLPVAYPQFHGEFVPFLSILDVLMFNDKMRVRQLLGEYELIKGGSFNGESNNMGNRADSGSSALLSDRRQQTSGMRILR